MANLSDIRPLFNRAIRAPLTFNQQEYWQAFNQAAYGDAFKGAAKYIGQEAAKNRVTIVI